MCITCMCCSLLRSNQNDNEHTNTAIFFHLEKVQCYKKQSIHSLLADKIMAVFAKYFQLQYEFLSFVT